MMETDPHHTLVDAYRREKLSFLQYVRQATPYAGPADRPLLERVRELARKDGETLDAMADYLGEQRLSIPHIGAFPSEFTNYNFVDVRNLIPRIVAAERLGLASLDLEATTLPAGKDREWIEKLSSAKRLTIEELEKPPEGKLPEQ